MHAQLVPVEEEMKQEGESESERMKIVCSCKEPSGEDSDVQAAEEFIKASENQFS